MTSLPPNIRVRVRERRYDRTGPTTYARWHISPRRLATLDWSFDTETKRFELVYSTRRAEGEGAVPAPTPPGGTYPGGSRSEVFVPAMHYPDGYSVQVKGAEVVSAPGAHLLELSSCAGAQTVELVMTPGAGPAPLPCPG